MTRNVGAVDRTNFVTSQCHDVWFFGGWYSSGRFDALAIHSIGQKPSGKIIAAGGNGATLMHDKEAHGAGRALERLEAKAAAISECEIIISRDTFSIERSRHALLYRSNAQREIVGVEDGSARGELHALSAWHRSKLDREGFRIEHQELVQHVTGRGLTTKILSPT